MCDIPPDIKVDDLPGPKRGQYPAHYFRDDIVCSPSGRHFALAYTIAEASMCNDVGCLLWGVQDGNKTRILCNPSNLTISCWQVPFCRWLSDEIFVCKVQRPCHGRVAVPNLLVDIHGAFWLVPDSNQTDSWIDHVELTGAEFEPWNEAALIRQIEEPNRVEVTGLRLSPLPHHPACGSAPGGSNQTNG